MLSYCRDALSFVEGITFETFQEDRQKRLATERAIEIIGEAAKGVPESIRALAPEIEWRRITGMRDKLSHHYFGIQLDVVWNVVVDRLPELAGSLESLLDRIVKEEESA